MERMVLCVVFFFCFQLPGVTAQTIHSPIQTQSPAAGVYAPDFSGAFSFTGNQAALAFTKNLQAGIFSERKWLVQELGFVSGALCFPAGNGGIGMQMQYFGFSEYNESKFGLSYGRRLGQRFDLGIQFNYYSIHMASYGQAHAISSEIGLIVHVSEQLHVGIHLYNPVGGRFDGNSDEQLASVFKTGFGYEISGQVYFQLDLVKEENWPAMVDVALHLMLDSNFFGGIGIRTNSLSPFGWAGWTWHSLSICITVSHQPQLGFTPGISIQIGRNASKKEKA